MDNTAGSPPEPTAGMQFDRAEFEAPTAPRTCSRCNRLIADSYYEAAGKVLCADCSQEVSGARSGRAAMLRALAWGGGAALLGTIIWYAIVKITGYELGLIAIGVGLMVGAGVRKGARGRGGWKYQALAMALTYVSITASYVPMVIKAFADQANKQAAEATTGAKNEDGKKQDGQQPGAQLAGQQVTPPAGAEAAAGQQQPGGEASEPPTALSLLLFLAIVLGIAMASPFMAGVSNIMGVIIIGIALYEAWKLNRRVVVTGPFSLAGPAAVPAPDAGVAPAAGPVAG